jgi:putative DNA primase/helicase
VTALEKLQEIERLGSLPEVEYELMRKAAAAKLAMRVAALDAAVHKKRGGTATAAASTTLAPPAPEPWPQEVSGSELLDEIHGFIKRFIVVDQHVLVALSLWAAFTYLLDIVDTNPRLAITSPTKRCGKSLVLSILSRLVYRPLQAANVSPAALFRAVDLEHPTLLIDEADTMPRNSERSEEIRGIVNSGHTRDSAFVLRAVKFADDWIAKKFSTWTPIVVAAIGELPETWEDRSVSIPMKRKSSGRKVERLIRRNKAAQTQANELAQKIVRWTSDHKEALAETAPDLPEELDDRAQNNWEPLLAVAERCGGEWPRKARAAAIALSAGRQESVSVGEDLLSDIKQIFEERKSDQISSANLCVALVKLDLRPWAAWGRRRQPITQNQVARLLKRFGISFTTIRLSTSTAKGYRREDFEEAFSSYIPPYKPSPSPDPPDPNGHNVTTAGGVSGNSNFEPSQEDPSLRFGNGSSSYAQNGCDGVTDQNREYENEEGQTDPSGVEAASGGTGAADFLANCMPSFIPNWLKFCLNRLAYSDAEIRNMTPKTAHEIIFVELQDRGIADADIPGMTPAQKLDVICAERFAVPDPGPGLDRYDRRKKRGSSHES